MIQTKTWDRNYISDVCYVPALHNNILSIGQLLEKGYNTRLINLALTLKTRLKIYVQEETIHVEY